MSRFRTMRGRIGAIALGAALLTTATAQAQAQDGADAARFDANKKSVKTGQKVKVEGRFVVPQTSAADEKKQKAPKRERVTIEFQKAGQSNWKSVAKTTARKDGSYSQKVKVKVTGRYRAVNSDGVATAPERIRAKSKLKVKVSDKSLKAGEKTKIKGRVIPRTGNRKVTVKVGGKRIKTRTKSNGKFKAKWSASGVGSSKVRAKAKGDKLAAGSGGKAGKVTVFRPAVASWYGPGFYGNRTACGQTLTTGTVGVAHKTMPCGTKLKLHYKGKTVPVKVIDRGPYHGNREFDLTGATKQKLGFGSTGTVWASK